VAEQRTSDEGSFLGRLRDRLEMFAGSYPARFAIFVFAGLNLLFAVLLATPWAAADGQATPPIDAFFQAVSVVCVTGLTVVDMATHWSPFGNAVVMIGVEVGGIGVLTLASLLGMTVARRLGLRQRLMVASDTNPSRVRKGVVKEGQAIRLGEVGGLLRIVAISVLVFEAALIVLLFPRLLLAGKDPLAALYESTYWSIMAFTNSGFVPTVEGLAPYATDPWFLIVLMLGVFIGSLGFPVYFVLLKHLGKPRQWSLHVKLTISVSIMLFLAGGLVYLVLEWGNADSWGTRDFGQQVLHAFFLSSMARSGGFAIDDLGLLHNSSILFLAAVAEARGRKSMEAFDRRIPSDVLRLAVSVTLWSATIIATVTVVLLEITGAPMSFVLFDVISAFGTVGLSTGFTHEGLEDSAKVILALTMFAGRIGSVTLAAALAASQRTQLFTRPEERPIVG
jgi:Trk-type K+ transport system membrane component